MTTTPYVTISGKLETLTNSYSAGLGTGWVWGQGSGGGIYNTTGQKLNFSVPAATASANVSTWPQSAGAITYYDLTESYCLLQLISAGAQSPGLEAWAPQLIDFNGYWYGWHIINGTIQVDNEGAILWSAPYAATTFQWLRIREHAGTTFFDYSSDGNTWTNAIGVADSSLGQQVGVYPNLFLGTNNANAPAGSAVFDNFNLPLSVLVPGNQGRVYNLVPNRNYQGAGVSMGALSGMTLAGTVTKLSSITLAGGAALNVAGLPIEVGVVAESATAGMSITAAPVLIQGGAFGPTHLLSPNDADFETGVGSWAAKSSCTVAQTTAAAHTGTGSLAITSTTNAAGQTAWLSNSLYAVIPGQSYKTSFWVSAATVSRSVQLQMNWYTSGLSNISGFSTTVSDPVGSWATTSLGPYAAPANAAYLGISWYSFSAQTVGEVHYLDTVVMDQSPGAASSLSISSYGIFQGAAALSATAGMNVAASVTQLAGVTLAGGAALNVAGAVSQMAAVSEVATSTLTVATSVIVQGGVFGPVHLLSAVDSDFETGIGTWTPNAYCSLAQTTAVAHTGTGALAVTITSAGGIALATSGQYPVTPGLNYGVQLWAMAAATARNVTVKYIFYDASHAQTDGVATATMTDQVGTWNKFGIPPSAIAPSSAAYMAVQWAPTGVLPVNEVHYADTVTLDLLPGAIASLSISSQGLSQGSVAESATAGMTVAASVQQLASVTLAGGAALNVAGLITRQAAAPLVASTTMTVGALVTEVATVAMTGTTNLAASTSQMGVAVLSATAGLTVTGYTTEAAAVALVGTAGLKITGVGMLFGPNYGKSWSTLTDGLGAWVNPQYADAAPDALYATWTAP